MRGQLLRLLHALRRQGRIAAETAFEIILRLAVPHEIKVLYPTRGNDVPNGRVIGKIVARGLVLNAAVHRVHANPAAFLAHGRIHAFVVGQTAAEIVQRLLLRHVGEFGQPGLALDGSVQQEGIVVDALHKKDGAILQGGAQLGPLLHRAVGRVDDGHVAALVQPRPGALHVLAGDLFSQPPGTLVVGIEEFGGTALRPEKHPA